MTATCCPLSSNDSDAAWCQRVIVRTARKTHTCVECYEVIAVGSRYEYISGIWDGSPASFKTCSSCVEIRDHFACNGWLFGKIWSDIEDNFFPDMKAGGPCMEGLSPEAKARLFERRLKWMEDSR